MGVEFLYGFVVCALMHLAKDMYVAMKIRQGQAFLLEAVRLSHEALEKLTKGEKKND